MGLINDMKVIFQSHNNTKRDRKNPDCWNLTNDMPSLTGKVIIVTGTTSGLGERISKHLINKGAKVYMLARNTEKGQQHAKELNQEAEKIEKGRIPGGHSVFVKCDFSDLSSVRKAAEEIKQKEEAIHILICNAGVQMHRQGKNADESSKKHPLFPLYLTAQEHELNFGIGVLGHHFLIKLLQPFILTAAKQPDSIPGSVRIVTVSSMSHEQMSESYRKKWNPSDQAALQVSGPELYGRSKLGIMHLSFAWADEMNAKLDENEKIVGCTTSPGIVETKFFRNNPDFHVKFIKMLPKETLDEGCTTILFGATQPVDERITIDRLQHAYITPIARFAKPHKAALDVDNIKSTWRWCEEQCDGF